MSCNRKKYISIINDIRKEFKVSMQRIDKSWNIRHALFYKDELNCILRDARYDNDISKDDFKAIENAYIDLIEEINETY